jgi:DNA-3-methyladenine glycosylase II
MPSSTRIKLQGPFDLALSLKAAARFLPPQSPDPHCLRTAAEIDGQLTVIKIQQQPSQKPLAVEASSTIAVDRREFIEKVQWLISADLDLRPFYRIANRHALMRSITKKFAGLKPLRPSSLFELAVATITEQQLSLAAAYHIRSRLTERFGAAIAGLRAFPAPRTLAGASLSELRTCGLSLRKAEYVKEFASKVANGTLDLVALGNMTVEEAHARLLAQRGFGEWSTRYVLLRGLGCSDCLPASDTGLRRSVGKSLARGQRLGAKRLQELLEPFVPFRGLAAFYLSVAARMPENLHDIA